MKLSLLDRLEKKFGRYAIPNLGLYIVIGQVGVLGFVLMTQFEIERIAYVPAHVLNGEIWRIFTFIFIPPETFHYIFMAFALYIFHLMSSALESVWGVFKYNVYILIGCISTIALGFFVPEYMGTNAFVMTSVFLAFAFINPNFELLFYFLFPVKVKWFALLTWLYYGLTFFTGSWGEKLYVTAACANFMLFFSKEILQRYKARNRRIKHHAEAKAIKDDAFHTCNECGVTDKANPDIEFRYHGDDEYCMDCLNKMD